MGITGKGKLLDEGRPQHPKQDAVVRMSPIGTKSPVNVYVSHLPHAVQKRFEQFLVIAKSEPEFTVVRVPNFVQ